MPRRRGAGSRGEATDGALQEGEVEPAVPSPTQRRSPLGGRVNGPRTAWEARRGGRLGLSAALTAVTLLLVAAQGLTTLAQPTAPPAIRQAPTEEAPPALPLPIGVLGPLSGEFAPLFQPSKRAIEMAVATFNAAGGIDGRHLRLIFEDTRGTAGEALAAAERALSTYQVAALITGLSGAEVQAVLPVSANANIPQLVFSDDAPAVTRGGSRTVFRVSPSAELLYGNLIDYAAADRGWRSFALVGPDSAAGRDLAESLRSITLQRKDGTSLLTVQYYELGRTEFSALLHNLNLLKPQAVLLRGPMTESALIVRQARKLGWEVPFLGGQELAHPFFYDITDTAGNGVLVGRGYEPGHITGKASPASQQRLPTLPGGGDEWHAFAYDAVLVLANAFRKAGTSGDQLFNVMRRLEYRGVTGDFKFSRSGDAVRPIYLSEWQDGAHLRFLRAWDGFKLDLR
ncbi:MAG: ABC transporter substrate-binding protein [Candidatus Tectomicrobia bacterium]|nr:ABC transporter substrate-binding protein [Candidatus Tectomicrobia bacterium]